MKARVAILVTDRLTDARLIAISLEHFGRGIKTNKNSAKGYVAPKQIQTVGSTLLR